MRAFAAVIVGYLAMAAFVFASLSALYLAIGTERAFEPASYEVTTLWLAASTLIGLVAGLLGGLVCAAIAVSPTPPKILAGIVLLLGALFVVPVAMSDKADPGTRTGDVDNLEAMSKAIQPVWIAFLNPIVGGIGVLFGAGMRRRSRPAGG